MISEAGLCAHISTGMGGEWVVRLLDRGMGLRAVAVLVRTLAAGPPRFGGFGYLDQHQIRRCRRGEEKLRRGKGGEGGGAGRALSYCAGQEARWCLLRFVSVSAS